MVRHGPGAVVLMLVTGANVAAPFLAPLLVALRSAVLGVGGVAIGIGVTIWALKKMWVLFKGLLDDGLVRGMTWNYDGGHPGGAMNERGASTVGDGRDWSRESAEYDLEMNSTGPDHEQYSGQTAGEQDAAASSYLDRYRGKA